MKLTWGPAKGDTATFASVDGLEERLRDLSEKLDRPTLVELRGRGHTVVLGLGRSEVVLTIHGGADEEDDLATEWIAVGDREREGQVDSWLFGEDHCELGAWQLIPRNEAIAAAVEFLRTLELPVSITWDENDY